MFDLIGLGEVLWDCFPDRRLPGGAPSNVAFHAQQRLNECGEAAAARDRHVAHHVALAEAADLQWRGPDQDAWMARFRQEHENPVAARFWRRLASEVGTDVQERLQPVPNKPHIPDDVILSFATA